MTLGAGQIAQTQARLGIGRLDAMRLNYYAHSIAITIDNGGVPTDVARYVAYNGWSVSQNLNDEVDTATIALLPTCPFVPQTRSIIRIGLGSSSNLLFAGIILTVQRTRKTGPDPRSWYDLTCVDWMALLDAHLMTADYPTQSVTTTILDIIARFTRAGFSTAGVAAGLPSIPGISIVNDRPSTVLRRITNKIGGGFYVDADRVVRAWSSAIASPVQDPPPQPLTDHLSTLKTFRVTEDASQQRTRVWVEGQSTSVPIAIPFWNKGGGSQGGQQLTVPLTDAHMFDGQQAAQRTDYVRLGSMLTDSRAINPTVDPTANPPGTTTTAAVAAGATVLPVANKLVLPPIGWVSAGGQSLSYQHDANELTPFELWLPASPQYGSLQAGLSSGTAVVLMPALTVYGQDRLATTDPTYPLQGLVDVRAQLQGAPAVLVAKAQDDAAASTIAARESSDGYYEHIVQDGRYNRDGALGRAQAELADFAQPLLVYEWETDDINTQAGQMQHIALTEGTPLTADVRITNVTITPLATDHPPRRQVRASKVITAGVVDIWVDDAR